MKKADKKEGLLTGIRVLDIADEKAAFCAKLLADLGAHVIKVEKPGGDSSRLTGPFKRGVPHPERSLSFLYTNTNKLGITLNIECRAGRELFIKLTERTDILVESYCPGYLEKLGLDFDFLSEINPGLIMTSVTGFGQTGPRKDDRSCDSVAAAYGGWTYVSGLPSMPPIKPWGEQSYITASLYAAVGVLLAIRKRSTQGRGEHIDISLQESAASTLDHVMIRYFHESVIAKRNGNRHWNDFFWVLPCKDGFIHLTPFISWETLVQWLDSEGMAGDLLENKYKDNAYRTEHADHILEVLGKWTRTHTAMELFETAQLMHLPWAPVHSPKRVLSCPHLKARKFFQVIKEPYLAGGLAYPGLPFKLSGGFSSPDHRAPHIGEDNIRVYKEELGLSEEDLAGLISEGVI